MVEVIDLQPYWKKLADGHSFSEEEMQKLLKMAEHFRQATAYLADCQAATAQGLPASTSKSSRSRHVKLCEAGAKLIVGDSSPIRFATNPGAVRTRCLDVVQEHIFPV
jgi:hypothetical protein